VPLPARHLFPLRLSSDSFLGMTRGNTVGCGDSVILLFLSGLNKKLSVSVTPAMQLGCTLWPLTSLFDCSIRNAQLLFKSGTSSLLSNNLNMKQNMARTLLHHARRDIKPFNTWPCPSRSSVIFCDWTPAPILSAVKVNQDSFLIDRIESWQMKAQPFWSGLALVTSCKSARN
jgi:hypothetical protein